MERQITARRSCGREQSGSGLAPAAQSARTDPAMNPRWRAAFQVLFLVILLALLFLFFPHASQFPRGHLNKLRSVREKEKEQRQQNHEEQNLERGAPAWVHGRIGSGWLSGRSK